MTSNQIIESLKEVIVSLKAQLEVYRLEREQDKRQINALMSIITGLRKEMPLTAVMRTLRRQRV